jgi:preprotein translocase subunit SecG
MENVILVSHLFLALAIIGLVLLQRSEGGGLGIGGGGGLGGLATPKGTANLLSRATGICAAAFFTTSLLLGILAGYDSRARHGILDAIAEQPPAQETPAELPAAPAESMPAPAAPISE